MTQQRRRTPTQQLADHLLGQPVEAWASDRRANGTSWRRIALDLRDATSGMVDVTPTTLMIWDFESGDIGEVTP